MRRHAHSGNDAAESFVSFISLFGSTAAPPGLLWPATPHCDADNACRSEVRQLGNIRRKQGAHERHIERVVRLHDPDATTWIRRRSRVLDDLEFALPCTEVRRELEIRDRLADRSAQLVHELGGPQLAILVLAGKATDRGDLESDRHSARSYGTVRAKMRLITGRGGRGRDKDYQGNSARRVEPAIRHHHLHRVCRTPGISLGPGLRLEHQAEIALARGAARRGRRCSRDPRANRGWPSLPSFLHPAAARL